MRIPAVRPASLTCSRKGVVKGSAGLARAATRCIEGSISRNSSTLFPAVSAAMLEKPVMLPPGRAKLVTSPTAIGSATAAITIGMVVVACFAARAHGGEGCHYDIYLRTHEVGSQLWHPSRIAIRGTQLEDKVLTLRIAEISEPEPQFPCQ